MIMRVIYHATQDLYMQTSTNRVVFVKTQAWWWLQHLQFVCFWLVYVRNNFRLQHATN